MILADFKLHPLRGSKFFFRIRIFDTKENMEYAAVGDGSMTGEAQARFAGNERHELGREGAVGDIYLYDSPELRTDAVHEITHAAVHYVRELRGGDLDEPNVGEYASAAEELLCRTMENLIWEFCVELARFKNVSSGSDSRAELGGVGDPLDSPRPGLDKRAIIAA